MSSPLSRLFSIMVFLALFAGANHCLLEEALGIPAEPVHSCPAEESEHQHGSPCTSVITAVIKDGNSVLQAESVTTPLFPIVVFISSALWNTPTADFLTTGRIPGADVFHTQPLLSGLSAAPNAPPLRA